MSGDVQPRKRKDKRRKKDEVLGQEEPVIQASPPSANEDFNIIHVHNDHGTGGGICAKLVFFVLLSILAVLIGMIFIEKRGLTDLETAPTESRFANIFEGFIDESINLHEEDHAHEALVENDDHDEHEEHEVSEEASIEHDEHEVSEEQVSEEIEELEETEEELEEAVELEETEEEQIASQEEEQQETDEVEDVEQEISEEKQEEDEEIETLFDASNEDNEAADTNKDTDEKDDIDNTAEDDNESNQAEDDIFEDDINYISEENEIVEEDSAENTADDLEVDEQEEEVVDNTAGEEDVLKEETEKEEEVEKEESSSRLRVLPDEGSEESDDDPWTKENSVPADLQQKLKLADANLRDNPDLALKLFTNLMEQLPNYDHIKYGRAQALDQLAELRRSNQFLQDAISSYYDILQSSTISDKLYLKVAERCIDRIRFRGHYARAVQVHREIIKRFPNDPSHRNQLAVTLLTSNRLAEAKSVLQEVLSKWPNDGFALAHYGFILKTKDNDMHKAVEYLQRGIRSRVPGVIDGRFYFHLGDALQRMGKNDEAMKVYEDGVQHKVFLSKYQRSLYNVDRLTAKPWWRLNQTPYVSFFKLLEDKWKNIREEGLALLNKAGYFKDEAENLRDTGQWKQFELFARGQKFVENCKKCPETCTLIDNFPDAKKCRRGQVKFSVMHPGTHVWPHCGPSNCRLRAHLGLKVPPGTFIRVADETRSWTEGKVFIFDDSFEHEVWHNGTVVRLVLIVDVWHPELTAHEKRSLPAI